MQKVIVESGITAHDLHLLNYCLPNNHPIEWVAVKQWEFFVFKDVATAYVQREEVEQGHFLKELGEREMLDAQFCGGSS